MPTLLLDGCTLHYRLHTGSSPCSVPPLMLVHGAGGNLMHWPGELRRLQGNTVYALDLPDHSGRRGASAPERHGGGADLPGCGRSRPDWDIGAYAEILRGFARALHLPRFVLAGHSMGGAVALEFALYHQEMLAGLVLMATGAKLPVAPDLLAALRDDYENATGLLASWSQGVLSDVGAMRIYLQRLRELDPEVLYRDYAACNAWDRTADIEGIVAPTLIICGDADRMTPLQYSLDLRQRIKTSQLVVAPGAGHMVMLEQPVFVASAVQGFLAGLEG